MENSQFRTFRPNFINNREPNSMAYQAMPDSRYYQPSNSNYQIGYAAPPSYESSVNRSSPAPQNIMLTHSPYQSDSDDSELSLENRHEPDSKDDDILAQATEFTRHFQQPLYRSPPLPRPVVIPQTISGIGQPFARCWAPTLQSYGITQRDFVEFIDNLNIVATANPPLQILDLAAGVLGMVPSHIAQLVGTGVQVLAKLGTVVVSKSRTDTYMKVVNRDYFAPRGLKATIASREAMAMSLRLPGGVERLAPITNENVNCSTLERRLEGMRPYMSELRFDVPPPAPQTTLLAKMSASQVKRRAEKAEKDALKRRRKQMEHQEGDGDKRSKGKNKEQRKSDREMRKLDREARKVEKEVEKKSRKGGRSAERAEEKSREKMAKITNQRATLERKLEDVSIKDSKHDAKRDKESKQAMKTLWILIENL